MNKVFPPLPWVIQFYWYYSSLTMVLTWLITPLLFYVILTQSKNLNTFKWLLLNHSFWCLIFSTVIGLFKPLIFLPAFGGFPLGLFRENGSFALTGLITAIEIIASVNCVIGLAATTFSRYLLAFPSKLTNWFNYKFAYFFIAIFTIFCYAVYFFQFLPFALSKIDAIKQEAIKYDSNLVTILEEPGFFYIPRRYDNKLVLPMLLPSFIIITISLIVMFIFVYLVTKFRNTCITTTTLQRSLIISSIMQILLTISFLFLPLTVIAVIVALEIPNSTNFCCFLFCLLSTHSVFEFSATLYFVSPYRKYVCTLYKRYFGTNFYLPKIVQISAVPSLTTDIQNLHSRENKIVS